MKINDTIPVTIAGQTVAQAKVKEVSEGQVTLVVPATLVVMATRTEIDTMPEVAQVVEPEKETQIIGVERSTDSTPEVPAPVATVPAPLETTDIAVAAPVGDIDNSTTSTPAAKVDPNLPPAGTPTIDTPPAVDTPPESPAETPVTE